MPSITRRPSGWSTTEPNSVPVTSKVPRVRVTSTDAPRARSARRPASGSTRESPVSSVSSVNGVGVKAPVPVAMRIVQPGIGPRQHRYARRRERPVLRVKVGAAAERHCPPGSERDFILPEHRRRREAIVEVGQLPRIEPVLLERRPDDPDVAAPNALDRRLAKPGRPDTELLGRAEPSILRLPHGGTAHRDQDAARRSATVRRIPRRCVATKALPRTAGRPAPPGPEAFPPRVAPPSRQGWQTANGPDRCRRTVAAAALRDRTPGPPTSRRRPDHEGAGRDNRRAGSTPSLRSARRRARATRRVPAWDVRLISSWRSSFTGRLETRLMTPPSADAP